MSDKKCAKCGLFDADNVLCDGCKSILTDQMNRYWEVNDELVSGVLPLTGAIAPAQPATDTTATSIDVPAELANVETYAGQP